MKRAERWLVGGVLALVAFVSVQISRAPRRPSPKAVSDSLWLDSVATAEENGPEGGPRLRRSALPAPGPKDYTDIARQLSEAHTTTYIDDILAARQGNIGRWVDRRNDPIRVWIDPRPGLKDFFPDFAERARDAFYTWSAAGVPLKFLFLDDSTQAEILVHWVDRFADAAAGKTFWSRDQHWWIVGADVQIAVHRSSGEPFDAIAVRTITLHEVGHAIGLDHSPNADDVMSARVHVTALSATDLRTASLIYHLPPGAVLAPPQAK